MRPEEVTVTVQRRPVIAGVDGSTASFGAARWAADEAVRLGQPLNVIRVVEPPGPAGEDADEHRVAIDIAAACRQWQPGLDVTAAVWGGDPAAELCGHSRNASLVVVASRGFGGFHSLAVGSVSTHLAGYAHCPVLVVHHGERWAGPESMLPRHLPILVGVDGPSSHGDVLGLAFDEAAHRHVPLIAMHAWQRPSGGHGWSAGVDGPHTAAVRELAAAVEPWLAKYPTVDVSRRVVEGTASTALLSAGCDALMVVLGARGAGGFQDLRLGAVVQQVLHHTDVPVLVVRHDR